MKPALIVLLLGAFLLWLIFHSRIVLHGSTLIVGLVVLALALVVASRYFSKK